VKISLIIISTLFLSAFAGGDFFLKESKAFKEYNVGINHSPGLKSAFQQQPVSKADSARLAREAEKRIKDSINAFKKQERRMQDSIARAQRAFEREQKKAQRDSVRAAERAARAARDSTSKALRVLEAQYKQAVRDSINAARKAKPQSSTIIQDTTQAAIADTIPVKKPIAGDTVVLKTPAVPKQIRNTPDSTEQLVEKIIKEKSPHPGRNGALTEREMQMARIAWKYFENNYQPTTGMVNNVDNFPNTTMWDAASSLAGLVAAYELDIIDRKEFDRRMLAFWQTMQDLPLFKNEMPNKVYHTVSKSMVDYSNNPGEIGVSALDLGRFLIWARIIKERYPVYSDLIDKFIMRWDFCKAIDREGHIIGSALLKDGKTIYLQEGRLGYEEYGAKGFQLWGFNTSAASKTQPYATRTMYGIEIPYDTRDPRVYGAHNYVVSESYVLDGIELNWDTGTDMQTNDMTFSDPEVAEFGQRIYNVQEERYKRTGIPTARSEHQLEKAPYFVYDVIYTDGYPWNTITEDGKYVPQFAAIALKAAVGLWALWETKYTDLLFTMASQSYDPNKGFYEGIYENDSSYIKTFTANNNGIILATLLYKSQGKLLRFTQKETLWDKHLIELKNRNECIRERTRR
jgi:hypothetical protein